MSTAKGTGQWLKGLDVDDWDNLRIPQGTPPGNPNSLVINESGLYSLILKSRKPEAKAFKKWVTSEVLPTIRKTGGYMVPSLITKTHQGLAFTFRADGWFNMTHAARHFDKRL
jgi:prophage antirepressor-like protein